MKLSSKHLPLQCRIEINQIYRHFRMIFNHALQDIGPAVDENELLTKSNYLYRHSENEQKSLTDLYIPFGEILNIQRDNLTNFLGKDAYVKLKIGADEKQVLEFCTVGNNNNVLLIVAPVGWGKSTLIFHSMYYVLQQSKLFQEKIIPIYLPADSIISDLSDFSEPSRLKEILYQRLIEPHLYDISNAFASLDDEEFWKSLSKHSEEFRFLEQDKKDFEKIYTTNKSKIKENVLISRKDARNKKDFLLHTIKTLQKENGKQVIFIFDDFDPLPLCVQETILNESFSLANNFNIKIIVCLRTNVYKELLSNVGGILSEKFPDLLLLNPLNVENYLKNRIDDAFEKIKTSKFEFSFRDKDIQTRITQEDGKRLIKNMLEILLNKSSFDFVGLISYFNLKRINEFVRLYLSNGIIENSRFYIDIIHKNYDKEADLRQPFWVLLSSVLTANYGTHFSSFGRLPPPLVRNYILNLYCNSRDGTEKYDCNKYFIRFHILNHVLKHGVVSFGDLVETYKLLVSDYNEDIFYKSLYRAIYRLLETNLLSSPEVYIPNRIESIRKIQTLEITETGRYYIDVFSSFFEYVMYMKDDIDLPVDVNISSCIDENDRRKQFENEVIEFMRFYFQQEKDFILSLDKNQRDLLLQEFSHPNSPGPCSPILIKYPLKKIKEYGEVKGFKTKEYTKLEKEIDSFLKQY